MRMNKKERKDMVEFMDVAAEFSEKIRKWRKSLNKIDLPYYKVRNFAPLDFDAYREILMRTQQFFNQKDIELQDITINILDLLSEDERSS